MFQNKRPSRRRHKKIMENQIPTKIRNKFWLIFPTMFIFWYLLIYSSDWSSLPALSSIHRQEDSNLINVRISNLSQNQENASLFQNPPNGDVIKDLKTLEKELEPLLPKGSKDLCTGQYIYVHNIASKFNEDLIKQCHLFNKWVDMCQYLQNFGLGQALGNPQRLFMRSGWYTTNQFTLEVIFHHRMKQYGCLTNDSSKADAIFVPYYPGLDISRYLFDSFNYSTKDADSVELFEWLRKRPEWGKMGGKDHFMVTGRITWDFRRVVDEDSGWGNKLMILPEARSMTILSIESSPWDKNDFAIPYPTYFHPSSDVQIRLWQNKIRKLKRRSLFCFAGAPRPEMDNSIRGELMQQCTSSKRCNMMECRDDKKNCLKPVNVMKTFQSSTFCLQPPGDSFTRRSTFDSIVAGCIPVFFSPGSAYVQYLWHLPKEYTKYSILISERDVKHNKVSVERVLSRISQSKVLEMRNEVVNLIPKVIYADPRSRSRGFEDAFDLTIKGVLHRIEGLRREMSEGRTSSDEFDEESSWKYYTFGTTKPHEWDQYFNRTTTGRFGE